MGTTYKSYQGNAGLLGLGYSLYGVAPVYLATAQGLRNLVQL